MDNEEWRQAMHKLIKIEYHRYDTSCAVRITILGRVFELTFAAYKKIN